MSCDPKPCADPAQLAYWEGRNLVYSGHARERVIERKLPLLRFLPAGSKLADVDWDGNHLESLLWKCITPGYREGYFLVLTPGACVITCWGKNDYQQGWEQMKNKRREHTARAIPTSVRMAGLERQAMDHLHQHLSTYIKPSVAKSAQQSARAKRRKREEI